MFRRIMFKRLRREMENMDNNVLNKVAALKSLGINISIIDKNELHKEGYTLGGMKDDYPNFEVNKLIK